MFLLGYLTQQQYFSLLQDEEMKVPTYVGGVCTYVWVCMEVRGQPYFPIALHFDLLRLLSSHRWLADDFKGSFYLVL